MAANQLQIELAPRVVAPAHPKWEELHDVHHIRHGASGPMEAPGAKPSADGCRRVDGPAKITGAAKYAVEQQLRRPRLAVWSKARSQPEGARIDTTQPRPAPGVLQVLTVHHHHLRTRGVTCSARRRRTMPYARCARHLHILPSRASMSPPSWRKLESCCRRRCPGQGQL